MADELTDKSVRELTSPAAGYHIAWDRGAQGVPGFGARITAAGAISFVFNYRHAGRERRMTIGSPPAWKVPGARARAKELSRAVDAGLDPLGQQQAQRTAPTVEGLIERYLAEVTPSKRPGSQREDKDLAAIITDGIGKLKLATLRRADLEKLHRTVTTERGPVRANRMLALTKAIFTRGIGWELLAQNPAAGIARNPEQPRERYLTGVEIGRLLAALGARGNDPSAKAILLLLLTGARRGEVLSATWDQFDLIAGTWTKPHALTKQKRNHRIPLSGPARQVLARMAERADGTFLFPSDSAAGTLTTIKKTWATVCQAAGIRGARLHDLRHSFASILASGGASLPVIGALLGHSNAETTHRYAHLLDDPLRQAAERVGAVVVAAGPSTHGAKVVPLPRQQQR